MDQEFRVRVRATCSKESSVSPVSATSSASWLLALDSHCHGASFSNASKKSEHVPFEISLGLHQKQSQTNESVAPEKLDSKITSGDREASTLKYPEDWSVKQTVKFYSRQSFNWACVDDAKWNQTLHSFLSHRKSFNEDSDPADFFQHATHHWKFPSEQLPPAISSMLKRQSVSTSSSKDMVWFQERLSSWNRAFESLFSSLRQGICPYFYYMGEEFHVLFCASSSDRPMTARLTHSNRTLRRKLQDHAINFTTPYGSEIDETIEQKRCREELRSLRTDTDLNVRETSRVDFTDFSTESLLAFTGRNDVVGIFNFLKDVHRPDQDVPTLLSPTAFSEACLKSSTVRIKKTVMAESLSTGNSDGHVLEVEGPILPTSLRTMIEALTSTQGAFEGRFVTIPRTVGLNVDTAPKASIAKVRCMCDGTLNLTYSSARPIGL
mmetsp:Transcript_36176/g.95125  ORF Transcript_36176/g.95125 Transcript_36176/m.95125 type:complete len:437 (-) Transcript_36176:244-1554(-)